MKFKPKKAGAVAPSQTATPTSTGSARKFAVPSLPSTAGVSGKPRSSVDSAPASSAPRQPSASPISPTAPTHRPPSASSAPSTDSAPVPTPSTSSGQRQNARITPSPSPVPSATMRAPSRSASVSRRSTTPSARVNGKLALLAAAENANVPLHIPASMDRKKRREAALAAKEAAANTTANGQGVLSESVVEGAPQEAAGDSGQADESGDGNAGASQSANGTSKKTAPKISVAGMPPTLHTAKTHSAATAPDGEAAHDDTSIEAIAKRAVADLISPPPFSRDGNAEAGPSSQPLVAAPPVVKRKPIRVRKRKAAEVQVDYTDKAGSADGAIAGSGSEDDGPSGEEYVGEKKGKKRRVASGKGKGKANGQTTGKGKGKGKGKAVDNGEEGGGGDEANDAQKDGDENEDEDADMEGDGNTKRVRMSDHPALKRKKREAMFPTPYLAESQPNDLIGSIVDEDLMSMGDLATVRSGEGRISKRSLKWQQIASELNETRQSAREERGYLNFVARQPMRRFIRAQMNAMRGTRRAEVTARGGNADAEVSADDEGSEIDIPEHEIRTRKMSPVVEMDADAERARIVAEQDLAAAEALARRGRRRVRAEGEEGEGEGEEEEDGEQGDDFIEDDRELHIVRGKEFRVPRGPTPEGEHSYSLWRMGLLPAGAEEESRRRAAGAGGGAGDDEADNEGEVGDDFYDNLGMGEEDTDAIAAAYHANREGVDDYDSDDPNREVVEVENANAFVNSATWSKKQGTMERWDKEQTDAFYYYLSIFGENFSEMEGFFAGRTHRQLKNKSRREQRVNMAKYESFLKNRRQPDADEFEKITSWRSSSRTLAAQRLLAATLAAPALLAKEDAEMRKRRKKRGKRGKGAQDGVGGGEGEQQGELQDIEEEDKEEGREDGEGLERMDEEGEGDGKDDGYDDGEDGDDKEEGEEGDEGEDDVVWDEPDDGADDWWQT